MRKPPSVSAYIAAAPPAARPMLRQLRAAIRAAAPKGTEERISYGMPYYRWNGRLAYFAAFRKHVSFFVMAGQRASARLAKAMAPYRTSKATLRFPIGKRVPTGLVQQLVRARRAEIEQDA